MSRRLRWFSAGAASAVATKLDLAAYGANAGPVYYLDTRSEHDDNTRFINDCQDWFGVNVEVHGSEKYRDVDDVIAKTGYIAGPYGARCTVELKKKVRYRLEEPGDVQVFGYTADRRDVARAVRFREQNPGVELCCPLIDRGLTKQDCLAIIERAGIEVPALYKLGLPNNNCLGCVKAQGAHYWATIRTHFPDVFATRIDQERTHNIGIRGQGLWLDELPDDVSDLPADPDFDCGLMCHIAENEIEADR